MCLFTFFIFFPFLSLLWVHFFFMDIKKANIEAPAALMTNIKMNVLCNRTIIHYCYGRIFFRLHFVYFGNSFRRPYVDVGCFSRFNLILTILFLYALPLLRFRKMFKCYAIFSSWKISVSLFSPYFLFLWFKMRKTSTKIAMLFTTTDGCVAALFTRDSVRN